MEQAERIFQTGCDGEPRKARLDIVPELTDITTIWQAAYVDVLLKVSLRRC